ncbi:MAG TPA: LysM domain-containing protein [Acidimicrobiales bacterium]|nr:LysM domain-containing protein [Acidimicrobiales bacterium]
MSAETATEFLSHPLWRLPAMVAIASLPTTVTPRRPVLTVVPPRQPSGPRAAAGQPLRSRWLAAALALAVVLAVAYLVATPAVGTGTVAPATGSHVAEAGDTMWSIAVEHAPAGEAAGYVEQLVAENGGATVAPGQVVTLPTP